MPCAFQASSILRYSVILFWRFLAAAEIVRVDVLQADEDARDAGALRLLDEVRDLVAERVDLDHQAERDPVLLAQLDQAVEDRLPFPVAREIVVGDEELVDALRPVEPHQMLDVVRRAVARLAALHVDDGAERALIGAAAAGVEAGAEAERARDISLRAGTARACLPSPAGPS